MKRDRRTIELQQASRAKAHRLKKMRAHVKKHGVYKQTPEDKALIDEAIAQGEITCCPPNTYAIDPFKAD